MRLLARTAATLVCIAPLAWVCLLFAQDVHERPIGHLALDVQQRLEPKRAILIPDPPDPIRYRRLSLRLMAAKPAHVELSLCAGSSCSRQSADIADGLIVEIPAPEPAANGGSPLTLTPTAISGGPVSLQAEPATPAAEWIQGYSWRLPARRARQVFHAFAGRDAFLASFWFCVAALGTGFAICIAMGLREARS
jgi:hypothetical protein